MPKCNNLYTSSFHVFHRFKPFQLSKGYSGHFGKHFFDVTKIKVDILIFSHCSTDLNDSSLKTEICGTIFTLPRFPFFFSVFHIFQYKIPKRMQQKWYDYLILLCLSPDSSHSTSKCWAQSRHLENNVSEFHLPIFYFLYDISVASPPFRIHTDLTKIVFSSYCKVIVICIQIDFHLFDWPLILCLQIMYLNALLASRTTLSQMAWLCYEIHTLDLFVSLKGFCNIQMEQSWSNCNLHREDQGRCSFTAW